MITLALKTAIGMKVDQPKSERKQTNSHGFAAL
jgi:hypothetical protein